MKRNDRATVETQGGDRLRVRLLEPNTRKVRQWWVELEDTLVDGCAIVSVSVSRIKLTEGGE